MRKVWMSAVLFQLRKTIQTDRLKRAYSCPRGPKKDYVMQYLEPASPPGLVDDLYSWHLGLEHILLYSTLA